MYTPHRESSRGERNRAPWERDSQGGKEKKSGWYGVLLFRKFKGKKHGFDYGECAAEVLFVRQDRSDGAWWELPKGGLKELKYNHQKKRLVGRESNNEKEDRTPWDAALWELCEEGGYWLDFQSHWGMKARHYHWCRYNKHERKLSWHTDDPHYGSNAFLVCQFDAAADTDITQERGFEWTHMLGDVCEREWIPIGIDAKGRLVIQHHHRNMIRDDYVEWVRICMLYVIFYPECGTKGSVYAPQPPEGVAVPVPLKAG